MDTPRDWDNIWRRKRGLFFSMARESLTKSAVKNLGRTGRFLEAGCGESYLLGRVGGFGIDNSREACRLSKLKARVCLADIYSMPYGDGKFDTVFSQSVLQSVEEPEKVVEEMLRVAKKGGRVAFTVPAKFSLLHLFRGVFWPGVRQSYWSVGEVKERFRALDISVKRVWFRQLLWAEIKVTG